MTTTTVNEQEALANTSEVAVEAQPQAAIATYFDPTRASKEEQPYQPREIKTAAQLLSLKMEAMLREFERETGAKIWSVRHDHSGTIAVNAQFEGTVIYA